MKRVVGLALAGVLAVPAGSVAQALDVVVLEATCRANTATEAELLDCLRVVHRYLVPGSGPGATPVPPVAETSAAAAIEWMKARGLTEMESISDGLWSAMSTSPSFASVIIVSSEGLLYSIFLDGGSAEDGWSMLLAASDHFAPGSGDWVRAALASTPPGESATERFGQVDVTLDMSQVVGSLSPSLNLQWPMP